MTPDEESQLDACGVDFTEDATSDDDIDGLVLFADVAGDPEAVERRKAEYTELFG